MQIGHKRISLKAKSRIRIQDPGLESKIGQKEIKKMQLAKWIQQAKSRIRMRIGIENQDQDSTFAIS